MERRKDGKEVGWKGGRWKGGRIERRKERKTDATTPTKPNHTTTKSRLTPTTAQDQPTFVTRHVGLDEV